tara:strand:- start:2151 stop:2753 length:603 start_codon:yes stop_codon:yes gene_type:complete
MYRLFTDKQELLEATVQLEGVSVTNTTCRVVVETSKYNLVFDGIINGDRCEVPINALKGILSENDTGKMYLEIIAEGTYFKPWESEYIVYTDKKVTVEVVDRKIKEASPTIKANIVLQEDVKTPPQRKAQTRPERRLLGERSPAQRTALIKNTYNELKHVSEFVVLDEACIREHLKEKYPTGEPSDYVINMVIKLSKHFK